MAKPIVNNGWQLGWQRRGESEDPQGMPYVHREWEAVLDDGPTVEHVARALFESWAPPFEEMWELQGDATKERFRNDARVCLAALREEQR